MYQSYATRRKFAWKAPGDHASKSNWDRRLFLTKQNMSNLDLALLILRDYQPPMILFLLVF